MRRALLAAVLLTEATRLSAQTGLAERAVDPAKHVIVLVNDAVPESVEIGKHYCEMRKVPEANVLHLNVTKAETTTWLDFREKILKPFTEFVAKFPELLYVVPTYGVPLRISVEKSDKTDQYGLGNSACVDAELALALQPDHEIEAWINNPLMAAARHITTEDRFLLISRLDGPTPAIARKLVDKAVYAETYGPEGKAFLDTRGMRDDGGSYGTTDEEMRRTILVWEKHKIPYEDEDTETEVDISTIKNCLFYWGWYTGTYNGTGSFKFNTGAVAAHLHSFSAATIRNDKANWVGPLLAHGVTCTMGTVFEPFTIGFPAMHIVYDRMLEGYTWGEATAMSSRILSWMCVFVGDPLYAPWSKGMKEAQERNRGLATAVYDSVAAGLDAGDLDAAQKSLDDVARLPMPFEGGRDTSFLERELAARRIAKATGTVAALAKALADGSAAADAKAAQPAWERALALSPMNFEANLALGRLHEDAGRHDKAIACLENARKVVPDAPAAAEPLGRALMALGKFKDAVPLLRRAAELGAGAEVLQLLGEACLKSGDPKQAVTFLADALTKDPFNRPIALALAKAHESAKDTPGQLKALQAAVAIPVDALEDIPGYKAAWKGLSTVAERAKDAPERARAALALADLGNPMFEPPAKGAAAKIADLVDDLIADEKKIALKAPPSEVLKWSLLPRLVVGNGGSDTVTIVLRGGCPRMIQLPPLAGNGRMAVKEIGVYPGEYELAILSVKGKEKRVGYLRVRFDEGKRYGLIVDGNLGLGMPPK
ncbi:MAG: TIGR03790 family protein [Planctomycetes bacterium]|nr:TIGR03790 family protein [Planctomycetota bacterium]